MNIDRNPYAQNSPGSQTDYIIRQLINKNINTCDWVKVVAVNSSDKTVDVTPLVSQLAADNTPIDHSVIHGLAYFRYQASVAALIITPTVGDMGLCVYAQNDVSGVQAAKKVAPPTSHRTFDYSDGCFIGLVAALATEPETFIEILDDKILLKIGSTNITFKDNEVILNTPTLKINSNVEFTGSIKSNGVNISNTHTHIGVLSGNQVSGIVS